jgi:hypothetical protein
VREYGKVAPQFWTGKTGRQIRELGADAQRVALYLLTGPSAHMIGLYHLALPLVAHHVGIPLKGASKALASLERVGFAQYDPDAEHVWVPEMARFQIAESLKAKDNRSAGIVNDLLAIRSSRFLGAFVAKYREAFALDGAPRWPELERALEGASQPLRSKEQEQEKEKEQEQETAAHAASAAVVAPTERPEDLLALWNLTASTAGLPTARELSASRRKHAAARLRDRPLAEWRDVVTRIGASAFCRGAGPRGWKADFDWLIGSPDVATRVLEGKYDDRPRVSAAPPPSDRLQALNAGIHRPPTAAAGA